MGGAGVSERAVLLSESASNQPKSEHWMRSLSLSSRRLNGHRVAEPLRAATRGQ